MKPPRRVPGGNSESGNIPCANALADLPIGVDASCANDRMQKFSSLSGISMEQSSNSNSALPIVRIACAFLLVAVASFLTGCAANRELPVRQTQTHLQPEKAREYYASLEQHLTEGGFLKTNGGADAGFSSKNLADNFERIALYDEFQLSGNSLVRAKRETRIRRWENPVRVSLNFGESYPEKLRASDTAFILDYLDRIGRATGQRIEIAQESANFYIFVLDSKEIAGIGQRLADLNVSRSRLIGEQIAFRPVESLCLVFSITESQLDLRYQTAIVVVKAEHPELMRKACYHEEIAQGFGLTNDSFEARPSIFNDNEEYAYLTHHDELLLRMLYDPRIKAGMTRSQAMPVVEVLAQELRPELDG